MGVNQEFVGGAVQTTLSAGVGPADLTVMLTSGTGYPTGAGGKTFVLALGDVSSPTATVEKILCSARSGGDVTVTTRGYDGTSASTWPAGTPVNHVWNAVQAQDLVNHVNDTTRDDHTQYLLESLFDANTVLKADGDNTPVALALAASQIVGRKASGGIVAMTMAELRAIIGSGTADTTTYLRGDGSWQVPPGVTDTTVLGPFGLQNLAASQTNLQLPRPIGLTTVGARGANVPHLMDRAGSIIGLTVGGSAARTAGTATFEVYKNGAGVGLTVVINGTNTQYFYGTQAVGTDTFVAGDRIDVRVTTDASWAPTNADWGASVTVSY